MCPYKYRVLFSRRCPGWSDGSGGAGRRGSRTELTEIWARVESGDCSVETTHCRLHTPHITVLHLLYYCQASQGSAHTFGQLRSEPSDSRHPNIICNTQTIQTNARIITHLQILAINTRQTGWGHRPVLEWKYHR